MQPIDAFRLVAATLLLVLSVVSAAEPAAAAPQPPPSFIAIWGEPGSGDGQFTRPLGVGVNDETGDVYVAEQGNHRIQQLSATGAFIRTWGTNGTADGQFIQPADVAVNASSGDVYVTDEDNHRIQQFTATGTFVRTWGTNGTADGQFNGPYGIAVNATSGDVYVVDRANHRIQRFTATGTHLTTWGGYGGDPAKMNDPTGVAVSRSSGDVYVADMGNHRIQQFTATGTFVRAWGTYGNLDGQFASPAGVAVSAGTGDVYVAEYSNHRIQRFTSTGSHLSTWGGYGGGAGQFNEPIGLAVNGSTGDVYVADYHNDRIQRFGDTTEPTVNLITPADGATYDRDAVVNTDYTCLDELGGSGIDTCVGDVPVGSAIDTSTSGDHDFSVTATDQAGNTATVTHTYTVAETTDPTVDLVTPPEGAVYAEGQVVAADYSCSDEPGGSGIDTCVATPAVTSGSPIDTATVGDHTFAVTATDQAGNDTTVTHTYTVALARPDGRIQRGTSPLRGNDIYNTLPTQTVTGTARPGATVTYYASIQNDAPFNDSMTLRGQGSTNRFTLTYRNPAGQNITPQVRAGTYTTPQLATGGTHKIKITVTIRPTAPTGASLTRTLTATSTTHPTRTDTVRTTTRRT